jgi:hypothetical protein
MQRYSKNKRDWYEAIGKGIDKTIGIIKQLPKFARLLSEL